MIKDHKSIANIKMVEMEVQSLFIHPFAQREILPSKIKRMKKDLDLDAIGVLHAVDYPVNGKAGIYVLDGQHRWRVLMDEGLGEWQVEIAVHLDVKNDAQASALFLMLNDRSLVTSFAKFNNELMAEFPVAVGVKHILSQYSLKLTRSTSDGCVACPASLKKVYAYDDGKSLKLALNLIFQSWGRRAAGLEGKMIEGMGLFCKTYGDAIDQVSLVRKLAKYQGGASALFGDARGIQDYRRVPLPRCIAEIIINAYNKGRKDRLQLL